LKIYVVHLPQETPLDAESEGEGLQSPPYLKG